MRAALAGIFVDRYDCIRIPKFVFCSVNVTLNTERRATALPLSRSWSRLSLSITVR